MFHLHPMLFTPNCGISIAQKMSGCGWEEWKLVAFQESAGVAVTGGSTTEKFQLEALVTSELLWSRERRVSSARGSKCPGLSFFLGGNIYLQVWGTGWLIQSMVKTVIGDILFINQKPRLFSWKLEANIVMNGAWRMGVWLLHQSHFNMFNIIESIPVLLYHVHDTIALFNIFHIRMVFKQELFHIWTL